MNLKKIIKPFVLRAKPFGYLQYLKKTLSDSTIRKIRHNSQLESQRCSKNKIQRIYQWLIFYKLFDRALLEEHQRHGFLGYIDYSINLFFRVFLFPVFDSVFYILKGMKRSYYVHHKVFGNVKSKNCIIIYTKGKNRENLYSESRYYKIVDLVVSNTLILGRENQIGHQQTCWATIFKVIALKFQFPYVKATILETNLIAENLFLKVLIQLKSEMAQVNVLVREGATPINRTLTEVAHELEIKTTTLFTNSFFAPDFPIYTNRVVVPMSCSIKPTQHNMKSFSITSLGDNPFIKWRNLATGKNKKCMVGIIPETGFFGYEEKVLMDCCMFDGLGINSSVLGLLRVHPMERENRSAMRYYRKLISQTPNITLDDSVDIEDFLQKVSVVVTNSESSTVEQALTCGRPVVIVKGENSNINDAISLFASGLVSTCSRPEDVDLAVKHYMEMECLEIRKMWECFILKMGFPVHGGLSIDEVIDCAVESECGKDVKPAK